MYRNDVISSDLAKGGVAICVHNDFQSEEIHVSTELQAIVVQVFYPIKFSICSIYLSPNERLSDTDIRSLIRQLPQPFMILGDINSHNCIWDNETNRSDRRGKIFENIINDFQLNIFNNGTPTHFNSSNGSYSAIDVSICSPELQQIISWKVNEDRCGSDHHPLILSPIDYECNFSKPRKWF